MIQLELPKVRERRARSRRKDPEGSVIADDHGSGDHSERTPDEALVVASLRGDETAFAQLVQRYLRKALAVAIEYVRAREDAEDVVQDTFRRVFQNLRRFEASRSFGPWFFTILRNTARNAVKSERIRGHEMLNADHESSLPGPFEETRRLELRRKIDQSVDALPSMQRTCFRLCVVEGFSSAEAASATGLAESTVRVHVYHARRALRGLLDEWREEVEEA
jgi:RNA polymerase sigma-70 factor (ECF subfamily)